MGRTGVLLLTALVVSALGTITSQHQARKRFIELDTAQLAAKQLDEEFTQLQLEQSTWATHKRVEGVASRQLGMKLPDPASTVVVTAGVLRP